MTGLFDEGAGDLDSEAFQSRLDDAGAEMRFSGGRDAIYGSMRMLADRRTKRWNCCGSPSRRRVSTSRRSTASAARSSPGSSPTRATPAPLRRSPGRRRSTATIPIRGRTRAPRRRWPRSPPDDLKTLHRRLFARDNLIVGVVGAIDAETLKKELDRLFGGLPEKAELTPVADVQLKLGQEIDVPYDLPQTTLQVCLSRRGPQQARIFRRLLMNHILGGGDFSSRLFTEVREKRGLAYSVGSGLVELRSLGGAGDFDGDTLRPRRRDDQGDPRRGQADGRKGRDGRGAGGRQEIHRRRLRHQQSRTPRPRSPLRWSACRPTASASTTSSAAST